jgi:hypothetical protein
MGAQIASIDAPPVVIRFLTEEGLRPGSSLILRAIGAHESRLVEAEKGYVELSADIGNTIQLSQSTTSRQVSPAWNSDKV